MVDHNLADNVNSKEKSRLIAMLMSLVVVVVMLAVGVTMLVHFKRSGNINEEGEVELSSAVQMEIEQGFQEAVSSNDDNIDSGIDYLESVLASGHTEEGLELSGSDVFDVKISLASSYARTSQYDKSIEILDALEATEESDYNLEQIYGIYIYIYNETGDFSKVQEYLNKFEEVGERL